ncbi:MAG: phasin family protein [Deferribacteraceae bacterium]|jgi:polyhydroxyalkanoate synthesis regulator phasin|nr:phasin family protein [Deferribacteraceae bacterium]
MNQLERIFYTSVGVSLKGKEFVEAMAKKFVDDHKMTFDEGKKFIDDMVSTAENTKEDLTKTIEETTEKFISQMGLTKQSEVETLRSRIDELEAELKKLKGQ